jgi:hypothetical protein
MRRPCAVLFFSFGWVVLSLQRGLTGIGPAAAASPAHAWARLRWGNPRRVTVRACARSTERCACLEDLRPAVLTGTIRGELRHAFLCRLFGDKAAARSLAQRVCQPGPHEQTIEQDLRA